MGATRHLEKMGRLSNIDDQREPTMETIKKLQEQEKDLMRLLEEVREQIRQEYDRYIDEHCEGKRVITERIMPNGNTYRITRIG